jgi:hypothetical protein
LITREAFSVDTSDLAVAISDSSGLAAGWKVAINPQLTGKVFVQPRWLVSAVWQLAHQLGLSEAEPSTYLRLLLESDGPPPAS